MKCHYTYTEYKGKIEKALIPMCMNVVHSRDIKECVCENITINKLAKKEYSEVVQKLQKEIKELEDENKRLNETIKSILYESQVIKENKE